MSETRNLTPLDELDGLIPEYAHSAMSEFDGSAEDPPENAPDQPRNITEDLNLFFPYPKIRPVQTKALSAVAIALEKGKKFTLIEAPTGSGKSGLTVTVGLHAGEFPSGGEKENAFAPGAYILTSQKSLSAQMVQDFREEGLVELRGKANYFCAQHGTDCETGSALNNGNRTCQGCPYRQAKNAFIGGSLGVTNYSYFIAETRHGGEIAPRDFLILDEAHNVEREILNIANISINNNKCRELDMARGIPQFRTGDDESVRTWLKGGFMPALTKLISDLRKEMEDCEDSDDQAGAKKASRDLNDNESLSERLGRFIHAEQPTDWMSWITEDGVLNIRPLVPGQYAHDFLFRHAKNVLLLSATLLDFDTLRHTLAIKPSDSVQFRAPSEFPKENRRILFWPAGSMGFKSAAATTPQLLAKVEAILSKRFPESKGIIHTHTYKLNGAVMDYLVARGYRDRLITHGREAESREAAIRKHLESPLPTVLLSPSMTEGLDLKDDLSRFQIICKIPYPFLDPYNRARMERDPAWYRLQTAVTLLQATGRSIRSKDDYALTIILDSDFSRFLSEAGSILPEWWKEAIEVK